jgi:hypothetical protein
MPTRWLFSSQITAFIPLLDQLRCLRNVVVSADMTHTQREHAGYLHRRGAYFVLPVGGNQPGLFDQLDAWIVNIQDLTPLVRKIHRLINDGNAAKAKGLLPPERVYPISPELATRIGVDT